MSGIGPLNITFTATLGRVKRRHVDMRAAAGLGHDLRHPWTRQGVGNRGLIAVLGMMSPSNDDLSVIEMTIERANNRQRFTIICNTATDPFAERPASGPTLGG